MRGLRPLMHPHQGAKGPFDTRASQINYFYAPRLPGEPAAGVADRHFHPAEPLAVRFTLSASP
jgi:hypothetical protein